VPAATALEPRAHDLAAGLQAARRGTPAAGAAAPMAAPAAPAPHAPHAADR
jgi:hypothetical protein